MLIVIHRLSHSFVQTMYHRTLSDLHRNPRVHIPPQQQMQCQPQNFSLSRPQNMAQTRHHCRVHTTP